MDELGVETGISTKNVKDSFIEDCTIDTDQVALIPDTYIDVPAEKIRIYKELDSVEKDSELDKMAAKLTDRFGPVPEEVSHLFDIVRIRHRGKKLGFEKIIIKNGILIAFFISNPMSSYYKSKVFTGILEKMQHLAGVCELNNKNGKLRIISRKVDSLAKAYDVLGKLL